LGRQFHRNRGWEDDFVGKKFARTMKIVVIQTIIKTFVLRFPAPAPIGAQRL
jgi:hypothetical protein